MLDVDKSLTRTVFPVLITFKHIVKETREGSEDSRHGGRGGEGGGKSEERGEREIPTETLTRANS